MNKSVIKYMLKDVIFLTVVGCVLEGLCAAFSGYVFNGAPTICVSLLVVTLLVIRWNAWGLISIPFLALATMIGGNNNILAPLAATYNVAYTGYQLYASIVLGLLMIGLDVILFKKIGTKKCLSSYLKVIGIILLNYVMYNVVQYVVYILACNIPGTNLEYIIEATEDSAQKIIDLRIYGTSGIIYNMFGLFVAIVGILVLRSQGVVANVVDKLVEDKKNAELIKFNTEQFRIEDDTPAKVENEVNEAKDESCDTKDSKI